jgi:hypothetical protein
MINNTVSKFKTEQQIKEYFNTTFLRKEGNIIQVQHYQTKMYHYLVENMGGWNILEMTSINPLYGKGE